MFPGRSPFVIGGSGNPSPLAQVWVFTTHENPKLAAVPLAPLYRMSWKCGDATPFPPLASSVTPRHIDTLLVNTDEIGFFQFVGYRTMRCFRSPH